MYTDPWEQYSSEPSSPVGWQDPSDDQPNTQRNFYTPRAADEVKTTTAVPESRNKTVIGRKNGTEDRTPEIEKEHWKGEEGGEDSYGLSNAWARVGLDKEYMKSSGGDAKVVRDDVNGDALTERASLPQQYDQFTSRSNTPTTSMLGGLYKQFTQSLKHSSMPVSSLPSSPYSQQLNVTISSQVTEDIYHTSSQKDQAFEKPVASNSNVGNSIRISQHVSAPMEDGVRPHDTTSTPFGSTFATWQSSPYVYVQSGQIGSRPEMTARRSNGTRISQNVRRVSDTLRRNPNRKENTMVAATMAFTSPIIDMPHVAYDVSPASPSPSSKKVVIPKAQTSKAESSKSTTAKKKSEAKKVTAKTEMPKPMTPPLSRHQEHKSHINKLNYLERSSKFWSSTGQKCDVKSSALSAAIKTQLNDAKLLGSGGFSIVHRVTLSGIPLARKGINVHESTQLDDVKTEVDHLKSLSGHKHIVQLVGTYVDDTHPSFETFYILTFPVADCDMKSFLAEYEKSLVSSDYDTITKLCNAAGIAAIDSRYTPLSALLRQFLNQTLGCITTAIAFMHNHKISHDDIKPDNILLRSGCIYLTDFGISHNRQLATQTSTERFLGLTYGWNAPEKGEADRYNPFQADIYSLGCIFMHVISIVSGEKKGKDCALILHNYPVHREPGILRHFEELAEVQWADGMSWEGWMNIMALTMEMLSNDRHARPKIEDVNSRLVQIGGTQRKFHNVCCRRATPVAEAASKLVPHVPRPLTPRSEVSTISNSNNHTIAPLLNQTSPVLGLEQNGDSIQPLSPAEDNDRTIRPAFKSAPHRASNIGNHVALKRQDDRMDSVFLGAKEQRKDSVVEPVTEKAVQDAGDLV